MRREQRVAAYGLCRTHRQGGGVVLVRASSRSDVRSRWFLPGGLLAHGEDPATAVARRFRAETGLDIEVTGLRDVVDDVIDVPHRAAQVHTVRVVFDVREAGGEIRPEAGGLTDLVAVTSLDDADDLPLMPFAARVLGLSTPAPVVPVPPDVPLPEPVVPVAPAPVRVQRQRVGVYGLVVDAGQVLLTRLAAATPAPGRWTLPGGGIDHGEPVRVALVREVHEESGLTVRSARLRAAVSHRFFGTSPAGVAEDYHGVQVVFVSSVDPDRSGARAAPRVVEAGGTTDAAAWVAIDEAHALGLTGIAAHALTLLTPEERAAGGGVPDPGGVPVPCPG